MRGWRTCTVAVAVALQAACQDDTSAPESAAERFCGGLCEGELRCGSQRDATSCVTSCVNERPGLANLSSRGADAFGNCVRALDCFDLYDDAAFDGCWVSSRTAIAPTPHVRSFCATLATAYFDCGYALSTAECEGIYGMWHDAVLDRVLPCTGAATCPELDACVAGIFESL
jgi:hypothetical protein